MNNTARYIHFSNSLSARLNYVLRTLRSYEASILAGSGVIWTAIFAVPILGERLAFHQIVGIAMMLVGFPLVQVRRGILK